MMTTIVTRTTTTTKMTTTMRNNKIAMRITNMGGAKEKERNSGMHSGRFISPKKPKQELRDERKRMEERKRKERKL